MLEGGDWSAVAKDLWPEHYKVTELRLQGASLEYTFCEMFKISQKFTIHMNCLNKVPQLFEYAESYIDLKESFS